MLPSGLCQTHRLALGKVDNEKCPEKKANLLAKLDKTVDPNSLNVGWEGIRTKKKQVFIYIVNCY